MKPKLHSSAQGGASKLKLRRERVIKRLEHQLETGEKPLESARLQKGPQVMEDLSDTDIARMQRELEILKTRI